MLLEDGRISQLCFGLVVKEHDFEFSLLEMLQVHLLSTFTKHEH